MPLNHARVDACVPRDTRRDGGRRARVRPSLDPQNECVPRRTYIRYRRHSDADALRSRQRPPNGVNCCLIWLHCWRWRDTRESVHYNFCFAIDVAKTTTTRSRLGSGARSRGCVCASGKVVDWDSSKSTWRFGASAHTCTHACVLIDGPFSHAKMPRRPGVEMGAVKVLPCSAITISIIAFNLRPVDRG